MADHPAADAAADASAGCAPADAVRARLAHAALGVAPRASDAHVGRLTLYPHQRHAVARLRYALRHYGTALLADDVGLGKTAVALALLRDTPDAIVVAPAALRPHWTAALRAADLSRRLLTTESLGRDAAPNRPRTPQPNAAPIASPVPLIVVDEAHQFRNVATRRWQQLAALAADARVLLLSATPVHNRPSDLAALFRLTLGDHAGTLDAATLARLVVRRSTIDVDARARDGATQPPAAGDIPANGRPAVAPTVWLELDEAPAVLDALRTLPPAIAPRDGSATPDLDRYTLVRLWTSSDAALRAAIQRRRARALTIADALQGCLVPTRADLRLLTRGLATDPTSQQLSLLASPDASRSASDTERLAPGRPDTTMQAIAAYVAALQRARDALRHTEGDARRVAALRAIRARHPDARIVAFSWSADTVRAHYRALAPAGRVAMLTAAGGRIASGPLSRAETLARFAPLGQSRAQPAAIERITLLLTTDVLSEGLDLRDASVIVHLDLPWTPARLAQRTGRAVRPGAPTPLVHVYAFQPPPEAAADLRLVAHARAKRRAAEQTVGTSPLEDALTRGDRRGTSAAGRATAHLERDRLLERWSATCPSRDPDAARRSARPDRATAAVRCGTTGYLAVISLPSALGARRVPTLVAALGRQRPTSAPAVVRRALASLARARVTVDPPPALVHAARRDLRRWTRRRAARAALVGAPSVVRDGGRVTTAHAHTALLARTAQALRAAAPADRASHAAAAMRIRDALAQPMSGLHAAAIRDAVPSDASDTDWLVAAGHVAIRAVRPGQSLDASTRPALRVLVLLTE